MFGNIEIEKNKFSKTPIFWKDVDFEKVCTKIYFGEENINTLLVTCTMIIKLSHYI